MQKHLLISKKKKKTLVLKNNYFGFKILLPIIVISIS